MSKYKNKKAVTDEQIIEVCKTNGAFYVTWEWRHDTLRRQCIRLCHRGILKRLPYAPGRDGFKLIN